MDGETAVAGRVDRGYEDRVEPERRPEVREAHARTVELIERLGGITARLEDRLHDFVAPEAAEHGLAQGVAVRYSSTFAALIDEANDDLNRYLDRLDSVLVRLTV